VYNAIKSVAATQNEADGRAHVNLNGQSPRANAFLASFVPVALFAVKRLYHHYLRDLSGPLFAFSAVQGFPGARRRKNRPMREEAPLPDKCFAHNIFNRERGTCIPSRQNSYKISDFSLAKISKSWHLQTSSEERTPIAATR
jgi:hypothetical protein